MQSGDARIAWKRSATIAWRSLRVGGVLHPTVLLTLCIALLGATLLVGWGAGRQLQRTVAGQAAVHIELASSATDEDIQALYADLRALTGVSAVRFLPKAQALEEQRAQHPELGGFLDRFQLQNPFQDLFVVELRSLAAFDAVRMTITDVRFAKALSPDAALLLAKQEQTFRRMALALRVLQRSLAVSAAAEALLLLCLGVDICWSRLRHRSADRIAVRLMGGGWIDSDGPIIVELLLLLWGASVTGALCVALAAAFLPVALGIVGDPLLLSFVQAWSALLFAALPGTLLAALTAAPLLACVALLCARLHVPSVRHG